MAVGCKVVLTANLSTTEGLTNNTYGRVVDIIYSNNEQPPQLPLCVMVDFPNCTAKRINGSIAIAPIVRNYTMKNPKITVGRKQIPLRLAYSATVHTSQGCSTDEIIVDLGQKDFTAGLTYVALSRVTTIKGLFLHHLDLERYKKSAKEDYTKRRIEAENELKNLPVL